MTGREPISVSVLVLLTLSPLMASTTTSGPPDCVTMVATGVGPPHHEMTAVGFELLKVTLHPTVSATLAPRPPAATLDGLKLLGVYPKFVQVPPINVPEHVPFDWHVSVV